MKEPLFELIKSLTPSEKGYYKKYFSAEGSKQTKGANTLLFDFIDSQEEYDEEKLKKKFRNEKFLTYLPVAKKNLYEQILKMLNNFNGAINIYEQTEELLKHSAILIAKGHGKHGAKYISKAKELATEGEYFSRLIDILNKEQHNAIALPATEEKENLLKKLNGDLNKTLKQLENFQQYLALYFRQMEITGRSYQIRDSETANAHEEIMQHALMQNENLALSVKAKLYFYHNRFIYFSVHHQEKNAYEIAKKMLALCESSVIYTRHDPFPYLTAYLYVLNGASRTGHIQEHEMYLDRFKKLSFENNAEQLFHFMYLYKNALAFYAETLRENEFREAMEQAKTGLKKYGAQIRYDYFLVIIYESVKGLLIFGDYKNAIDWLELYRNSPRKNIRNDSQVGLYFELLIAHFELKNYVLVNNLIIPVYRFILRTGQQSRIEKIALRTFRKMSSGGTANENRLYIQKLMKEMDSISLDDVANKNKDLHEILSNFMNSKLEGKPFHEFVQQKLKRDLPKQ